MQVYQFRIWGSNFAVDTNSGNFFEIDKVISDAISLLEDYPEIEAQDRLGKKHGIKSAAAALEKISSLKKKRLLFSSKQTKGISAKRKITDLTLNIVKGCNLRCRYCWNKAGIYTSHSEKSGKMDFSVGRRAVDLLLRESRGTNDLVVDFYGGEPLLNFSLIKETIEYCRKVKSGKKINFRFLLATNGTLFNKERAEFLIENGVDVAVSIDGPRKVQDNQRPFPDGEGSFDVITGHLNSLSRDYRRRLVGRATFTPYSTDIIKTFRFLRGLGFQRIEVCESENAGYGLESRNSYFFSGRKGLERLKEIYYKLARFYTREIIKGTLTYENTYFNRFFKQLSRLYHIQSIVGSCSAGFSLMSVDMDGSIYPCTAFIGIHRFRIGNVKRGIDETRLKSFLDTRIDSSNTCSVCWARKICRGCGSCYNLNYFSNKKLGQPDPYYCELFRYKTKLMIAMIAEIARKNPRLLEDVLVPEYYVTRGRRKNNAD